MTTCPNCGTQVIPGTAFCDNCGYDLSATPPPAPPYQAAPAMQPTAPAIQPAAPAGGSVCPSCGAAVPAGAAFCDNCGASLRGQAAPPMPATAAPPGPMGAGSTCSNCGNPLPPGAVFCDNCGTPVGAQSPAPAMPPQQFPQQPYQPAAAPPYVPPAPMPPAPGMQMRLVVGASGAQIPLSGKAEYLIGREDPMSNIFPEADLTPHGGDSGGVSRQHAKIMVQGNQAVFLDMGSTNGSWVNKVKVQPNQRMPLTDGAEIRVGRVVLLFHTS